MKLSKYLSFILLLGCIIIVSSCSPAARPTVNYAAEAPQAAQVLPPPAVEMPAAPVSDQSESAAQGELPAINQDNTVYNTAKDGAPASSAEDGSRKIIKTAEIQLLVEDTDLTIDRITQITDDVGGYIISSKSWYKEEIGGKYKYSTITLGVPVDDFERALRRLRDTSIQVIDEVATGEDVSQEYVDLQSKLESLQATRARITGFLEDSKTVEEALRINDQLSMVEGQINETLGRMNYLAGRASYSTITVTINPKIRDVTPTPTATPTVTPTPYPSPTATPWNPGKTFNAAGTKLGDSYRSIVDALIWLIAYVLPIFAPWIIVILVLFLILRKKKKQPTEPK